jgi:hypothetical protein
MKAEPSPAESVITALDMALIDIRRALDAQMYYLALIGTLSLIDICSALETPDGKTDKHRFMAWYDKHLGPHYSWLSGQDCYGIRSGMLHQGVLPRGYAPGSSASEMAASPAVSTLWPPGSQASAAGVPPSLPTGSSSAPPSGSPAPQWTS